MTAPVSQQKKGEKIKMTTPVAEQRDKESWVVSFLMPNSYTIETFQNQRIKKSHCVKCQLDGWL
jgi:hypothetical protein